MLITQLAKGKMTWEGLLKNKLLITFFVTGIPELEGIVRRLDPFIIDDIDFNQANTEAANLYAHLTNLTATGLSKLQIKESR